MPENLEMVEKWRAALGVTHLPKSGRICHDHFNDPEDFHIGIGTKRRRNDAVPSKNLVSKTICPVRALENKDLQQLIQYLEYFTNTLEPPKDGQPVKRTCCLLRVLGALTLKIGYHDVLRLGYHILVVPILAMQWYFTNLALTSSNFVQNVKFCPKRPILSKKFNSVQNVQKV